MAIYLGLCSNLGDCDMNLVLARDLLMKHDVLVMGQSDVRVTAPLGGLDQTDYYNQVIEVQTHLEPEALLEVCKRVEVEMGRKPKAMGLGNVSFGMSNEAARGAAPKEGADLEKRWESRIMDIDILFYGDEVVDSPKLKVPHYGVHERDFELKGMCDLDADFVHPVLKKSMKDLLSELRASA